MGGYISAVRAKAERLQQQRETYDIAIIRHDFFIFQLPRKYF
jgi:hypothetical protein